MTILEKQPWPKPTKLMVCENHDFALLMQKELGPEWYCIGYCAAIVGRLFDTIVLTGEIEQRDENWLDLLIGNKLLPGGNVINLAHRK